MVSFGQRRRTVVDSWSVRPVRRAGPRSFPRLWDTQKAAERWLDKNPLEPHRDIIRVWEVLDYRAGPRHRRWSKALVRHGANPRLAVAEVLNLSVGEIQVRHGVSC